MAKEDRGGEGRTYRIRVAIVQLSGDQWGTRIIMMMNTSRCTKRIGCYPEK